MKTTPKRCLAMAMAGMLSACGGGGTAPGYIGSIVAPPSTGTPSAPPPAAIEPPAQSDTIAVTTEGKVAGIANAGTVAFLGIPYAQPPLGDLRWAPPQAPAAHPETLQATAFGSACLQGPGAVSSSSEDCLYLNVWKPAGTRPGDKLPVIFYIHGGAFTLGSGEMGPSPLASRGVVVVSINYRLGALGDPANKALRTANKDGSLGNFAVMDQLAALGWVQKNIAAFGGDAGNVTLWGTSAGRDPELLVAAVSQGQGPVPAGGDAKRRRGGVLESEHGDLVAVGDTAVASMGGGARGRCCRLPEESARSAALAQGGLSGGPLWTRRSSRRCRRGPCDREPSPGTSDDRGVYDEGTIFVDTRPSAGNIAVLAPRLAPGLRHHGHRGRLSGRWGYAVRRRALARATATRRTPSGTARGAMRCLRGCRVRREMADPELSFPSSRVASTTAPPRHWTATTSPARSMPGTYPYFEPGKARHLM